MGVTLSLTKGEQQLISLNWLRNPFGLEEWASCNVDEEKLWWDIHTQVSPGECNFVTDEGYLHPLYTVCNQYSYNKGDQVNRREFKVVIDAYWEVLKGLETSFFGFDFMSFMQFVAFHIKEFPVQKDPLGIGIREIKGAKWEKDRDGDGNLLLIPVEHFNTPSDVFHLRNPSTSYYKEWFQRLVEFAEMLQDPSTQFYCSN